MSDQVPSSIASMIKLHIATYSIKNKFHPRMLSTPCYRVHSTSMVTVQCTEYVHYDNTIHIHVWY